MPETHVSVLLRTQEVPRCENAVALRVQCVPMTCYKYDFHDTPTQKRLVLSLQILVKDMKSTVIGSDWKILENESI